MKAALLGLTVALLAISETQASCFGKDASWVVNVGLYSELGKSGGNLMNHGFRFFLKNIC